MIQWPNGDKYEGEADNAGTRDGHGKQSWDNDGVSYTGEFKKDQRHGHGRIVTSDGLIYEG